MTAKTWGCKGTSWKHSILLFQQKLDKALSLKKSWVSLLVIKKTGIEGYDSRSRLFFNLKENTILLSHTLALKNWT